jgi:FAD/FMN-containing dehydrogenase
MINNILSWGRYPRKTHKSFYFLLNRFDSIPKHSDKILPYGLGRSYGDSCLNGENTLLMTRNLDRFVSFDPQKGVICCESGVSFSELLDFCVPRGFFLPVTPGTKFVTVGGALANDIHGKNHHCAGNFGNHVLSFELIRSSGERFVCSPSQNSEYFYATLGGLGLTGLVSWVEFKLIPIKGPLIDQQVIKYRGLNEFLELSKESEGKFEYTVAWIDCLASGKNLGRGHFIQGNHSQEIDHKSCTKKTLSVPFELPLSPINSLSVKIFNSFYYHRQLNRLSKSLVYYDTFFYPLDFIHDWNRIYGRQGFLQYQCVVPENDSGLKTLEKILSCTSSRGLGSFLAVIKKFGKISSGGMLSFPRPGITLALDIGLNSSQVFKVLDKFDDWVVGCGGAIYPGKDARMSRDTFRASFPNWLKFKEFIDPNFSSDFSRRVEL